jgi:TolB-like protein/DNA-binding winged helix-turn-helix (wHTH) protein/thioredoxin-like negative regulator of GroEL
MKPTWAKSESERELTYRVDDLVIYPSRRAILRDGVEISLGKLTFDLLLLLVESAPNLVTPDEFRQKLWAGRFVSEDTVRQRIKLLRKALADDPEDPRYLTVIRGQGVRLVPEAQRIEEPVAVKRGDRRIGLVFASASLVLAVIAFITWPALIGQNQLDKPHAASIAVLPFETLSSQSGDEFFVDGFHNDLLTQLAGIEDLKVISRTSVIEYRDKTKNLRDIGHELGVATILEGSVQRSGDKVRINAQLIDALSDEHLWASAYDREVTAENLFDVQAEMAEEISSALQIRLTPQESARLREAPTDNIKAYNYYLLGQNYLQDATVFNGGDEVLVAYRNAIEEDPQVAEAWAALAITHSTRYFFKDLTSERREQAKNAIDQALNLKPDLAETQLALGFVRYHTERDYDGALDAWEVAEQGMPGDARLYHARAAVYARMGRIDEAVDNWERAVDLDPRNTHRLLALSWHLSMLGDYDAAQAALEKVVALIPENPVGYQRLAFLPLWRDGNGSALRMELDNAPVPVRAMAMQWLAAIYERDFDAANELLEQWPGDSIDTPIVFRPKSWFYGTTLKMAGDPNRARMHFANAQSEIEKLLADRPKDLRLKITLADIKANLGHSDEAINLASEVLENMPPSLDASASANYRLYAVKAYLTAGDFDSAINELDAYLSSPSVWAIEGLLPDPRFDPIRDDPQFVALVDRHSRR